MRETDIIDRIRSFICSQEGGIACVGTELRRDDAAGLEVCRELEGLGLFRDKLIFCPYGLENCLEEIIRKSVKKLLVVDAALPVKAGGERYVVTELNNVSSNYLATTHNIPVPMIVRYLRLRGVAEEVLLLGVVAKDLSFGEGLTDEVRSAVNDMVELIKNSYVKCLKTT